MFCIVFYSECWIKTEGVQGIDGISIRRRSQRGCVESCTTESGCVAVDFHYNSNRCMILTSTKTEPIPTESGKKLIEHYERIPDCKDKPRS